MLLNKQIGIYVQKQCNRKCNSKQHISELLACITKAEFETAKLYLSTCYNAFNGTDYAGRNVIHIAASCGKLELLEWILTDNKNIESSINCQDLESGWTPLHRAFYYGQIHIARSLIKHGADIDILDNEGLSPLDISMKDLVKRRFSFSGKFKC